jgi:hypothetical protein
MRKLLIVFVVLFTAVSLVPAVHAVDCTTVWQGALLLGAGNFGAVSCNQANNYPCGAAQGFPNASFCNYVGGKFDINLNFYPVSSSVNCPSPSPIGTVNSCGANAGTVETLNNLNCPTDYFSIVSKNYKWVTCTDASCSVYLNQNPNAQIFDIHSIASVPDQSISNGVCSGNSYSYSLCNSGSFVNQTQTCQYGCANSAGCLAGPKTFTAYCTNNNCAASNLTAPAANCYALQADCQNALQVTTPQPSCSPSGLTGASCISPFTSSANSCSYYNCLSNSQLDSVASTSTDQNVCGKIPNCYQAPVQPTIVLNQIGSRNAWCISNPPTTAPCDNTGVNADRFNFNYCPGGSQCNVVCNIPVLGLTKNIPQDVVVGYPNGWNNTLSATLTGTFTGVQPYLVDNNNNTLLATCVEYATPSSTPSANSCSGYTGKLLLTKDQDGCQGFTFCGVGFGSAGISGANPKVFGTTECAYQPIQQGYVNTNPTGSGLSGIYSENNILNSINTNSYCPTVSKTLPNSCFATAGQPENFNQILCSASGGTGNQYSLINSYVYGTVYCNDSSCSAYTTSSNYTVTNIVPYSFTNGTNANIVCDPYGNANLATCNNGNIQPVIENCTNGCFPGTGCISTQICQPNVPITVNNVTGTCNGNIATTTICNNLGTGNISQSVQCSNTQTCQNGLCINNNAPQLGNTGTSNGVPVSDTAPISAINAADWTAAGFGWLLWMFSPIFLDTLLMAGFTGAVSYLGSRVNSGAAMIVGSGTFLVGVIILTIFGIYPAWIGLILGLLTGFIFVRLVAPSIIGSAGG